VTIVWLNGALCDADAARIEPTDRGFTMGDGLFETIRAMNGVPARLPRHFARLREGAGVLGLPVPHDDIVLERALREVLAANALGDAVLRLTLTRGPAARGVLPQVISTPTLSITAGPGDCFAGYEAQRILAALAGEIAQLPRFDPGKTGSRAGGRGRRVAVEHAR
jgi:branched-chain amino acid aminotransferase